MNYTVNELFDYEKNSLLELLKNYSNEDIINELLDERDEDDFSDKWSESFENVEELKVDESAESEALRESIFKKVIDKTGSSDLASYISDDFGLLYDALNVNYKNKFIEKIWDSYKNNLIPR
ncbi:hypothetical protein [Flavobacterium columnare]|uniref:Uncharacterized protein n=1 Tax=Flavobacterium columnare TaxID=996 RepID=A0AAI8CI35_9FLAO|nr:hypothetical protein [Flavobacterium columnare]AMO20552.1 hypothetical protein UN65_09600 [Flavobacterium columnare]AUX18523.1 hypothetical protein AQ623_09750 [Flavobacterium columnare]MEB3801508.1 hypothetical protein [Flavobacterium columnare]QOG57609.1 hypothetical protein HUE29_09680 [Flavobacterium columnare]QOG60333.1 hypothetical protein HUE30_09680 [Flavobacterium columnare]